MHEVGYFNAKEAAAYVGYAYSTFRAKAAEFAIPRVGPKRNKYSKDDLDRFMRNPYDFLKHKPSASRRPKEGFKRVKV